MIFCGDSYKLNALSVYSNIPIAKALKNPDVIMKKLMKASRNNTRVGTLIVATIYLQLIQNRYMFQSFTVLQCSHQHCVQPVASDAEVIGYL